MHINKNGEFIYNDKFEVLGVFHKGFAIAKDKDGFFHINKRGEPIYKERYKSVEPFYNDFSFSETFEGKLVIIDIKGKIIHKITHD